MLSFKQKEFNAAMLRYHDIKYYQLTYKVVSTINITLEIILLYVLFTLSIPFIWIVPALIISYFIADFINGLVHLYMDNNDSYNTFYGAFVSSFHLHHKLQKYKDNNLFLVYFNESGTKFWLIPYLGLTLSLSFTSLNDIVLFIMILTGILSSFAEVSHYLCHNSNSKTVLFLQHLGLLLKKNHHKKHHQEDNIGYAFLNGMSDPLINKIASKFYKGYKYNSDTHYQMYEGEGTLNRD
ncbi:MAG: fatty acid desaturase CarF family protein [Sulfurimonas sp.]|nr:fatty acid desaturase CarF family protein [Sulfurimonas sp.]MDQ7061307.1 fatty acid desaturase CarF family protein [Sulfurimonas sp.]